MFACCCCGGGSATHAADATTDVRRLGALGIVPDPENSRALRSRDGVRRGFPVYVNVYHLVDPKKNRALRFIGGGIFHSGVEVDSIEYSFGVDPTDDEGETGNGAGGAWAGRGANRDDNATTMAQSPNPTGVFVVPPIVGLTVPLYRHIHVGNTELSREQITTVVRRLRVEYPAREYHVLAHNCNHFCETMLQRLSTPGNRLEAPGWVNRFSRVANFLVPRALATWAVSQSGEDIPSGGGGGNGERDDDMDDSPRHNASSGRGAAIAVPSVSGGRDAAPPRPGQSVGPSRSGAGIGSSSGGDASWSVDVMRSEEGEDDSNDPIIIGPLALSRRRTSADKAASVGGDDLVIVTASTSPEARNGGRDPPIPPLIGLHGSVGRHRNSSLAISTSEHYTPRDGSPVHYRQHGGNNAAASWPDCVVVAGSVPYRPVASPSNRGSPHHLSSSSTQRQRDEQYSSNRRGIEGADGDDGDFGAASASPDGDAPSKPLHALGASASSAAAAPVGTPRQHGAPRHQRPGHNGGSNTHAGVTGDDETYNRSTTSLGGIQRRSMVGVGSLAPATAAGAAAMSSGGAFGSYTANTPAPPTAPAPPTSDSGDHPEVRIIDFGVVLPVVPPTTAPQYNTDLMPPPPVVTPPRSARRPLIVAPPTAAALAVHDDSECEDASYGSPRGGIYPPVSPSQCTAASPHAFAGASRDGDDDLVGNGKEGVPRFLDAPPVDGGCKADAAATVLAGGGRRGSSGATHGAAAASAAPSVPTASLPKANSAIATSDAVSASATPSAAPAPANETRSDKRAAVSTHNAAPTEAHLPHPQVKLAELVPTNEGDDALVVADAAATGAAERTISTSASAIAADPTIVPADKGPQADQPTADKSFSDAGEEEDAGYAEVLRAARAALHLDTSRPRRDSGPATTAAAVARRARHIDMAVRASATDVFANGTTSGPALAAAAARGVGRYGRGGDSDSSDFEGADAERIAAVV